PARSAARGETAQGRKCWRGDHLISQLISQRLLRTLVGPEREDRVMNDLVAATVKELANAGWHTVQTVNGLVPENASLQPGWAPGPLIKSRERTKPPLGWPRETDSLCPRCVVETRNAIINGERDLADLVQGHNGEIKATILEENGRVLVRKTCPEHGTFEDVLSIDPEFSRIIEARYPGRDFRTMGDERIH